MELIYHKKFRTSYGSIVCNTRLMRSERTIDYSEKDILIIEDSEATASLISDYLKKLNYKEIHTCKDDKAGIKKFLELSRSNRLPLVFLDYYLPETDTISLFDQFLEIEPETKIIIDSVAGKDEDGIKYLTQHWAYHYLQKPFSFENLKKVMETFEKE